MEVRPKRHLSLGKVGIFSPSEALGGGRLARMEAGLDVLRRAGIEFRFGQNAQALDMGTSAGTVQERVSDILELLSDPEIDVLLGSWGGKAANQLLPFLPYNEILEAGKIISGFSDVAVILNAISLKTGLVTMHGPNVAGKLHESAFGDLRQFRKDFGWGDFNLLELADVDVLLPGEARGRAFGGNLNCFVSGLIASGWRVQDFSNCILFFEDSGLTPRVLEQYLVSLRNAGVFDQAAGVVFGEYAAPSDNDWMSVTSRDILLRVFAGFSGPVVASKFFGHSNLPNPAIPIGAMSALSARSKSWHFEI